MSPVRETLCLRTSDRRVERIDQRGLRVAPAGVELPMTEHHHLIIAAPLPSGDAVIPSDRNHLHFGRGQTETVLTLPPGKHTLQLMVGDHANRPHENPVVSRKITITVR